MNLTESLRYIFIILGARHKERLGIGIALGLVILFIYSSLVAAELLPAISNVISITGSIALGILIMFTLLWLDPKQRHIGEEEHEKLALIDELTRRGGLNATEKKTAYSKLLHKIIDHYESGKPLELEKDAKTVIKEIVNTNQEVLDNTKIKS